MRRRTDTTIWPSVLGVAADAVQGAYDEDPQDWCESTWRNYGPDGVTKEDGSCERARHDRDAKDRGLAGAGLSGRSRARAKRDKAVIHRSGRDGYLQPGSDRQRLRPKRPETPILTQTGQKFDGMIAAVSNRGLMRFKLYKGALNVAIFIDFMKRLLKDAKQKVFLIVDNLRVHHAKAVQDWLARHKVEIEISSSSPGLCAGTQPG